MRNSLYITPSIILIIFSATLQGQDIDAIIHSDPLKVSGQMSFDQYFNDQFVDTVNFKDKYSLFLSGKFNAKIYSVDFPFQFTYTNKQENYSHPFSYNQFGAQPYYKWVKLYLGYNTVSFSPYTLSGHQFCGGGVELAPDFLPVQMTVLYGRLVKPVEYDSAENQLPSYDRRFYSYKLGYSNKKVSITNTGIFAWDIANSIESPPDTLGILPKENFATSFQVMYQLTNRWSINMDYGRSFLTDNITDSFQENTQSYVFLTQNKSSRSYNAYGGQIKYSLEKTSFGIQYNYVAPGYETLGAYYTNNDVEQISLVNATKLIQGKLNFNLNVGLERDNLANDNMMSNQRFAGSLNINAMPSENWSINGSYSSFQSYSNMRSNFEYINTDEPLQLMDTLDYRQISQSVSLAGSYSQQGETTSNSTSLSLSGNTSGNTQNESENSTLLFNGTLSQSLVFSSSKLSITASLFGSFMEYSGNQLTVGPVFNLGKPFWEDKIRVNVQTSLNQTWNDTARIGLNGNVRAQASLTLDKTHLITLSFTYFNTKNYSSLQPNQQNMQVRLTYSYRIQKTVLRRKRKKHDNK